MATIDKYKLISKLGFVAYFNEQVWSQIATTANNNIYHAGDSDVTLNKDKITKVKLNSGDTTGKYVADGTTNIKIKKAPQFSSVAYHGANTTGGSILYNKPCVLPIENGPGAVRGGGGGKPAHLKELNANDRQYFVITKDDIDARETTYWTNKGQAEGLSGDDLTEYVNTHKNVITADAIYSCCFEVLRQLIYIRPFKSTWKHDSSVANKKFTEKFNNGAYAYGIFIDTPASRSSWLSNYGSGTWGAGGSLSYWQISLGGNITKLNLTEESINRHSVYANRKAVALDTTDMVADFWNGWSQRCKSKNVFDYKFFSCHLNCHSSCHSSCHGSRSRR